MSCFPGMKLTRRVTCGLSSPSNRHSITPTALPFSMPGARYSTLSPCGQRNGVCRLLSNGNPRASVCTDSTSTVRLPVF